MARVIKPIKRDLYSYDELVEKLERLKPFLSKNVIDYLEYVLNLEISVFLDKDINNMLGELKDFRDIAFYNTVNWMNNMYEDIFDIENNIPYYKVSDNGILLLDGYFGVGVNTTIDLIDPIVTKEIQTVWDLEDEDEVEYKWIKIRKKN